MRIVFCLSAALMLSNTATAACPPPLDHAQTRQILDDEGDALGEYAQMRWLKCGWEAAEPAMREARAVSIANARADAAETGDDLFGSDEFTYELLRQLHHGLDSPDGDAGTASRAYAHDPAPLSDLRRMHVPAAVVKRYFNDGFDAAIAFLRSAPDNLERDIGIESLIVHRMVSRGDIDGARARVERLIAESAQSPALDAETRAYRVRAYTTQRDALAPPAAQSAVATGGPWVIDRSTRPRIGCGLVHVIYFIGDMNGLREHVLKAAPIDTAIAELLVRNWRGHLSNSDAVHGTLLAELLRRRHGDAGLRQGWEDAIALMRTDGPTPMLNLFGHPLPLPQAVREDDADAPRSKRGRLATRERPVTREELEAYVRASPLYRRSLGLEPIDG